MKVAWVILLISALTDFLINAGTSLMAAMMATGSATMPGKAVVLVIMIGCIVQAARTVQQALKITPQTSAALRGDEVQSAVPGALVQKG